MIEVLPAIIPKSFVDLKDTLAKVVPFVKLVQIDVTDGKFTGEASWPYKGITDPAFQSILREEEGFPFWEDIDFEADLMVLEPEKKVWDWIKAGAKSVIIHIETTNNIIELVREIKNKFPKDGIGGVDVGVAINTTTPNDKIYSVLPKIDFVQFMGIERIGFQGQPFDERVLDKISDVRGKFPDITIAVDGAVNLNTAHRLVSAGANKLVSGSAILESQNIPDAIDFLKNI